MPFVGAWQFQYERVTPDASTQPTAINVGAGSEVSDGAVNSLHDRWVKEQFDDLESVEDVVAAVTQAVKMLKALHARRAALTGKARKLYEALADVFAEDPNTGAYDWDTFLTETTEYADARKNGNGKEWLRQRHAQLMRHANEGHAVGASYIDLENADGKQSTGKDDAPRFSRSTEPTSDGQSLASLREDIGALGRQMVDKGRVALHATVADFKAAVPEAQEAADGLTQGGFHPKTGVIHLIAGNIARGEGESVLRHEGVHAFVEHMKLTNKPVYKRLMRDLADIVGEMERTGKGDKAFIESFAKIPGTDALRGKEHWLNEFAAYAVSAYVQEPRSLPQRLREWARSFLYFFRAALRQRDFPVGRLTPGELASLAQTFLLTAGAPQGKPQSDRQPLRGDALSYQIESQFNATARKYGGESAYRKAKAAERIWGDSLPEARRAMRPKQDTWVKEIFRNTARYLFHHGVERIYAITPESLQDQLGAAPPASVMDAWIGEKAARAEGFGERTKVNVGGITYEAWGAIEKDSEAGQELMYSRRLWHGMRSNGDFVVPETEGYRGNDTGDLAYVPQNDKGVPALPIRLQVGAAIGEHEGFGVQHIADNAARSAHRAVPKRTADKAENIAREVVDILTRARDIHSPFAGTYILAAPLANKAVVLHRRTDRENKPYLSVITIRPINGVPAQLWGRPKLTGRLTFPADESALLSPETAAASTPILASHDKEPIGSREQVPPGAGASYAGGTGNSPRRAQDGQGYNSERLDLSAPEGRAQAPASSNVPVTMKKRRTLGAKYSLDTTQSAQSAADAAGQSSTRQNAAQEKKAAKDAALKTAQDWLRAVFGDGNLEVLVTKSSRYAGLFKAKGGKSFRLSDRQRNDLIKLSLNFDVLGAGYHEGMHAFVSLLREHGGDAVVRQLMRVANAPAMQKQLRLLLNHSRAALRQLESGEHREEEALAYMFQFWMQGKLTIGPQTRTVFDRLRDFLNWLGGLVSETLRAENYRRARENRELIQAENVLRALNSGAFADVASRDDIVTAMNANEAEHRKRLLAVGKGFTHFVNTLGKFAVSAEALMDATNNPHIKTIARRFHQKAGEKMRREGNYLANLRGQRARWRNRLDDALRPFDAATLEAARLHLASGGPANAPEVKQAVAAIKKWYDDMWNYLEDRGGVWRLDGDTWARATKRKDYGISQVWDANVVAENQDDTVTGTLEETGACTCPSGALRSRRSELYPCPSCARRGEFPVPPAYEAPAPGGTCSREPIGSLLCFARAGIEAAAVSDESSAISSAGKVRRPANFERPPYLYGRVV